VALALTAAVVADALRRRLRGSQRRTKIGTP